MNQSGLPTPPLQPGQQASASNANTPSTSNQQSSSDNVHPLSLDSLLVHITTSSSPHTLNQTLRNCAPKDVRETILSSFLGGGQDPLTLLDIRSHTLGVLYILSARLNTSISLPPPLQYVEDFCRSFSPEQARYAPDRVTLLAKGIACFSETIGNPKCAITPLYSLVERYSPTPSHLTTVHRIFLSACVSTRHFTAALPVLSHPITTIDTTLSDIHYNDNLVYHYAGGMALAALKRWSEAEEFFEICVTSPGQVPAAIQMEALKKWLIVQLIYRGKIMPLPKYTNPMLFRSIKNTPYTSFANFYPQHIDQLRTILEKDNQLFTNDKTLGLLSQALERAPRWSITKLTSTYLTLGLSDIGRAVGIQKEEDVRVLILSMVESSEISAQISADGTVTFADPPPTFSKEDVDRVLMEAQEQGAQLARLEKEMARSREYLTKAVRNKDDSSWGPAVDDDSAFTDRAAGNWTDDAMFS
ncbi:hypothetical protein SERLA73DRAFT_174596 [Serpula lacrymans var. lacrymans S7.3]|uniref:COP9 signalosome complex subunit 3 N-terminal helical repeats domain-containing protein n=2 Tax=Serpula lacrymans var. lacrymans TaxID=341189 RepID=F8PIZ5_SERL3|nr:uncharacterized protein SERLADRAFT_456201 [Serpula lacrymans var. lacrymans S7.9]EGO03156.1 hypothetical protein SERLA73DRAFT_174596 [Serpula lacrymans var. lacrymans S7.3]EGO28939.1 hypothetical protein SERLADRAFT_456201 [Serpula lacrymans var. lacrymans S7.9]